MTEFSTSENNIPAFLIPTKDLDIKLLSIWLFWITACTHVKREREGFEGLQTVRLPYSNPLLLLLFLCCLISFCFSQFPPFTNTHLPIFPLLSFASLSSAYRVFSLTWPAYMQIYSDKRKSLHKKRVQLPEDWFGTPTWPPFHCFGTPIWPPWRHVKTLHCRHTWVYSSGAVADKYKVWNNTVQQKISLKTFIHHLSVLRSKKVPFSSFKYMMKAGRDFTSWSIRKGRKFDHFGLLKGHKKN